MIQIGRFKLGFAALSVIVVFIALSLFSFFAAFQQASHESPMPLSYIIMTNEGMALLATLVYGIFVHFALAIINRLRK